MSRNIGDVACRECRGVVTKVEANRPATQADVGCYEDFVDMVVANAECTECGAKYLAWVDIRGSLHGEKYAGHYDWSWDQWDPAGFWDLSYRSSFNDEPGDADLPTRPVFRFFARDFGMALFHLSRAIGPPTVGLWWQLTEWWAWQDAAHSWLRQQKGDVQCL